MKMYSVFDEKANTFSAPFCQLTDGLAIRVFQGFVNDDKTTISQYPEDFKLYYVGDFNDDTGALSCLATVPVLVISAKELVEP